MKEIKDLYHENYQLSMIETIKDIKMEGYSLLMDWKNQYH